MYLPSLIIALTLCLLGVWAIAAAFIFAPQFVALLDVSDLLSGLAFLGLMLSGKLFGSGEVL